MSQSHLGLPSNPIYLHRRVFHSPESNDHSFPRTNCTPKIWQSNEQNKRTDLRGQNRAVLHFQILTCDAFTRSLCRRSHLSWQMRAVVLSPVKDPHQFNSTSLTVWFNGRFVNVIIGAEINEQSGGQKRRDKSSKEISKGGKSAELCDKGPVLQMAQVQRRPFERCDSVKRDTEAREEVRRGTKEGTGSPRPGG